MASICRAELTSSFRLRWLYNLREALIRERHRSRAAKIGGCQVSNLKACRRDDLVNFSVEVAAASDTLPCRCEPVLPDDNARIGSTPVLDEDEAPARPQNALNLVECLGNIRDRTQSPGQDHSIHGCIGERKRL